MVELAFRIPEWLKVSGGQTKILLKKVASRHVPPSCVYRPKEGFSIPIKNWLCGELRPVLHEYLNPDGIARDGLFNNAEIARLTEEHLKGVANHSHLLWSLIVFHAWKRRWLEA
jgi:asparagine synthase (glutamine-hydrolysing)